MSEIIDPMSPAERVEIVRFARAELSALRPAPSGAMGRSFTSTDILLASLVLTLLAPPEALHE